MNEGQFLRYLIELEELIQVVFNNKDSNITDDRAENLSIIFYEIQKELNDLIENLEFTVLSRFTQVLQKYKDNQEKLPGIIQDEINVLFIGENIIEKVEKNRKVFWDDIVNFYEKD